MAKALRFIIVPKVAHPWFDEVNKGAQAAAGILSRELCVRIVGISCHFSQLAAGRRPRPLIKVPHVM